MLHFVKKWEYYQDWFHLKLNKLVFFYIITLYLTLLHHTVVPDSVDSQLYNYSPQTRDEMLLQSKLNTMLPVGKNVFMSGNFTFILFSEVKGNNSSKKFRN